MKAGIKAGLLGAALLAAAISISGCTQSTDPGTEPGTDSNEGEGSTYFVSSIIGEDHYPGTSNKTPFKTIQKAADLLQPGETVYVMEGVYRERVSPPRGGVSDNPITYMAAPGKQVIIKGSDVYPGDKWTHASGSVYYANLSWLDMKFTDDCYWDDKNPFEVLSSEKPYGEAGHTLGQVFVNGEPYRQRPVGAFPPGSWYYDNTTEKRVYVNFKSGHSPASEVEFTTRRSIFAPHAAEMEYITVKGFIMEHCGNQNPAGYWYEDQKQNSQAGALSIRGGNYWTIENNVIRYAGNVGIDVGWELYGPERDIPAKWRRPHDNIIRNNYLINNGSTGIAGTRTTNITIEGNVVMFNNQLENDTGYESAGMKFHYMLGGLIKNNYVAENKAYGIWMDQSNEQSRLTGNIMVDNKRPGLYVELSTKDFGALLIDHNIIMNNGTNAQVHLMDSSGSLLVNNLIAVGTATNIAVEIDSITADQRSYMCDKNAFYNNIIVGNPSNTLYTALAKDDPRGGEQRFLGNLYNNNRTGDGGPGRFNVLGTGYLNLQGWKDYWSGVVTADGQNDSDAEMQENLTASYDKATQSVTLDLPTAVTERENSRWFPANSASDYAYWIDKYTETKAYPGPFGAMETGSHVYSLYTGGLPPAVSGEIPAH